MGNYLATSKDDFLKKVLLFGLTAGFVELLADYWLVHGINSLVYPAEESKFWASPNYMPFAWAVILTQVGYLGWLFTRKYKFSKAVLFTFILGALFIPIFETCALYAEWWYYNDYKFMFMHTPLYIIIGEGLIAAALPFAFTRIVKKSYWEAAFLGLIIGLWIFVAYYLSYSIL